MLCRLSFGHLPRRSPLQDIKKVNIFHANAHKGFWTSGKAWPVLFVSPSTIYNSHSTLPQAVAENQPVSGKNRMTTHFPFSSFVAQMREYIRGHRCTDDGLGVQFCYAENEFNPLALALFALQFAHNVPYRQFCQSRQATPETIRHWSKIPAMPAAGFKELELTSLVAEQRNQVFYSSCTTGQMPSRHFHDAESLALYEASLLPWFEAHLLPTRQAQVPNSGNLPAICPSLSAKEMDCVILTPSPADAPHSSLAHMFGSIDLQFDWQEAFFGGQVGADGVWLLDLERLLHALIEAIAANRPVVVLGTAFNFVHLIDHLAETNRRMLLPSGSRVLETGGYKGRSRSLPKAELHSLIGDWLAVPSTHIVCEYGMSELSSQAYDCTFGNSQSSKRAFRFPPWARAQIISPETGREVAEGETGLIRIFDLANVRSVMAIQTEDLGVRRGDGFELLGRAEMAEPRGCSLMTLW
jgi:Acyl-protein synthetase, LuxE